MKEPSWTSATEEQVWKYVATHLAKNGIDTILVGGAVVAIYTEGAYRSGDLDFVLLTYLTENLPKLMKEIGFEVSQGRHYGILIADTSSSSSCEGLPASGKIPGSSQRRSSRKEPSLKSTHLPTASEIAWRPISTLRPGTAWSRPCSWLGGTHLIANV